MMKRAPRAVGLMTARSPRAPGVVPPSLPPQQRVAALMELSTTSPRKEELRRRGDHQAGKEELRRKNDDILMPAREAASTRNRK